jgi:transketolase
MSKKSNILNQLRYRICELAFKAQEGHVPSSLSILNIIYTLYDNFINLKSTKKNSLTKENVILSKGHGCIAQYVVLEEKKLLNKNELNTFGKFHSKFGGHPDSKKILGIDASTGSLGHGFPFAAGIAYAKKIKKIGSKVYCIVGDGECNEGTIWETCLIASHHKLNNLICLLDNNLSSKRAVDLNSLSKKFSSFGWHTVEINGHSNADLIKALNIKNKKPLMIICNTIKGKGIDFMEKNPNEWHHKKIEKADLEKIQKILFNI